VTTAIVVGGGVAGVSAGVELAERGVALTLLERRGQLGGKVAGWRDPAGASLEHGLHGVWPEYVNLRDLLRRAGVEAPLAPPVAGLAVLHRDGRLDDLGLPDLPAPFGALGLFRRVRSVPLRGIVSALPAGIAIAAFDPADLVWLDRVDMRTWARRMHMSERAITSILEPTIRANLFLPLERTSAWSGVNAMHRGMRRRDGWRFSWLRGNTGDHLWAPLARHLAAQGADVRLGAEVRSIALDGDRATGVVLGDGASVHADHVILAVDVESCKALLAASGLDQQEAFARLLNLTATDVLVTRTTFQGNVQLTYRELALIGFRVVDALMVVTSFQPEVARSGTVVVETQSYLGRPLLDAPDAVLTELVLRDIADALPPLADAHPAATSIARHRSLFTAFGIGFETDRPGTATPVANLHLAGDWVRAPEATMFMENAAITGRHAASAVLGKPVPIVPLPPSDAPVRLLQAAARPLRSVRRAGRRLFGFHAIGERASR
jgi:uncharacterized protein with NAD-binding domain and iron-sulfur cluster